MCPPVSIYRQREARIRLRYTRRGWYMYVNARHDMGGFWFGPLPLPSFEAFDSTLT